VVISPVCEGHCTYVTREDDLEDGQSRVGKACSTYYTEHSNFKEYPDTFLARRGVVGSKRAVGVHDIYLLIGV
jgi:hypothetical protein